MVPLMYTLKTKRGALGVVWATPNRCDFQHTAKMRFQRRRPLSVDDRTERRRRQPSQVDPKATCASFYIYADRTDRSHVLIGSSD
jgi:hypothetical protein